jgi:hypothetical protein
MKHTLIALIVILASCSKTETPAQVVKTCGTVTGKDAFANNGNSTIKYVLYWDQGGAITVTQADYTAYSSGQTVCVDTYGKVTK